MIFLFSLIQSNEIMKCLGTLDTSEQSILASFYNSLSYKGTLSWNVDYDLCSQSGTGITCDSSFPQRVTQLYFFFFINLYFLFLIYTSK